MDRTTGIQTILMTDVVGSTRLWSTHPQSMPQAVERMEALADAAIEAEGGRVVKRRGEGDSLFCLFPDPASAARAAAEFVRSLAAEPWPEALSISVRAAIHCGPAHVRGEDLFGPVPNRCARLREIAHGGQILLSGAARAHVAPHEAPGLVDLGRHRLRDLDEPEAVWQVGPASHPPLRSLTSLRNNLPVQYTSFIGREALRRDLLDRLAVDRITTLTGAGGCGKTRLALQLGAETIDLFPDGVWFVQLAEVSDEPAIVRAIGEACGFYDLPYGDVRTLANRFHGHALVLLDNAEHAIPAIGRVVAALMASAPELHFIVTSREPLRLRGERVHRVPPLSVPEHDCADAQRVVATEAGSLFLDRARLHLPGFALHDANALAISNIARRLDGIPLCLEMAATHVGYLGVDQIAARLNDRFALLEGDDADAPPRHRTMRETIGWQVDTLSQGERLLLRRLAAFVGTFTLDAVESVGGQTPLTPAGTARILRTLVDKSLVVAVPVGGAMSYRLLETIAQFAAEDGDDAEAAISSLVDWSLSLAREAYPAINGPNRAVAIERIDNADLTLRKAIGWTLLAKDARAVDLCLAMARYWHYRGRYHEAQGFLERTLRLFPDSQRRLDLVNAIAVFASWLGDHRTAAQTLQAELDAGVSSQIVRTHLRCNLGTALSELGRSEESLACFQLAHSEAMASDDASIARIALYNVALVLVDLERFEEAKAQFESLGQEYKELEDSSREAKCYVALSGIYAALGHVRPTAEWLERALVVAGPEPEAQHLVDVLVAAIFVAGETSSAEDAAFAFGALQTALSETKSRVSPRYERVVSSVNVRLRTAKEPKLEMAEARGRTASQETIRRFCLERASFAKDHPS